jgi:hypothetical protein
MKAALGRFLWPALVYVALAYDEAPDVGDTLRKVQERAGTHPEDVADQVRCRPRGPLEPPILPLSNGWSLG